MNHILFPKQATRQDVNALIEVRGLTKSYGNYQALHDVSFSVTEGHTLGLLGPSGCGKTTMLRCIAGLETPDSGSISIGGVTVFDSAAGINLAPEHRELGIVFQSYAIWPHMTVAENIAFPLKVRKVAKDVQQTRVRELLEIVGLSGLGDRSATQMSGGQQQRVALARALVHQPRLVLFDEALSNLDAQLREHMRIEIKLLQQKLGFTAVYVTHDQGEAFALAERILLMNRGQVEVAGEPRAIFNAPESAFAARFFGLNTVSGTIAAVEPPFAVMDFGGGVQVRGRIGAMNALLSKGDAAVLGIRREHVRVTRSIKGQSSVYGGVVQAASFQGLSEELVVDLGALRLRAVQPVSSLRVDDEVAVGLHEDEVFIFPAGV